MMVNQRLLPPTFPRYTKIKERATCIQYLAELIQRLKHVCKIVHCTNYHSALVSILCYTFPYCIFFSIFWKYPQVARKVHRTRDTGRQS